MVRVRFARSARKHGISRARDLYVIEHCGLRLEQEPPSGGAAAKTVRLVYLGDDEAGVALEVMVVELGGGDLLVIHAMQLREKYRDKYEEAKEWRK